MGQGRIAAALTDQMQREHIKIILIVVAAVVAAAVIYGVWRWLNWYIAPLTPTHRKDQVQVMAVSLGAVGAIITAIIGWRNLKQSQEALKQSHEATEKTIETTRLTEEERAQNDALQKYFEQIGQLLTKEKLRSSEEDADVRVLARSQTLTVLQGLSPDRKRILLRFLYESHLVEGDDTIVSLAGADLREANLSRASLIGASLREADLSRANLGEADLIEADLFGANLSYANLSYANLSGAKLYKANLSESKVTKEQLYKCRSLEGTTMPDDSTHD